jgi:hypothetical protein
MVLPRYKGHRTGRRIDAAEMAAMRADMSGAKGMAPIVRHTGSKNKPHYRMVQRNFADKAGIDGLQVPYGGPANDILNILPQGSSDYNEMDAGTAALVEAMSNQGTQGIDIDWSMLQGLNDQQLKDHWRTQIRGPNVTERKRGDAVPPDTLAYYDTLMRDGEPRSESMRLAQALNLFRNKRAGHVGQIRHNKVGNEHEGMLWPSNPPDVKTMQSLPSMENLLNYREPLKNVNVRQGDGAEALAEWDIDNKAGVINDPPYSGQPGTYGEGFDPRQMFRQLEERIQEGQPVLAFDSIDPIEQYKDIGLDTTVIQRPDNVSGNPEKRGPKPEMIGVANVDDFDGHSINQLLQTYGYGKFLPKEGSQTALLDFELSEPQNAFEQGWAVLKQGGQ